MDLTTLTEEELSAAFDKASEAGESLTPLVEEKARRMNLDTTTATEDVCPVDPADDTVCDSCA